MIIIIIIIFLLLHALCRLSWHNKPQWFINLSFEIIWLFTVVVALLAPFLKVTFQPQDDDRTACHQKYLGWMRQMSHTFIAQLRHWRDELLLGGKRHFFLKWKYYLSRTEESECLEPAENYSITWAACTLSFGVSREKWEVAFTRRPLPHYHQRLSLWKA